MPLTESERRQPQPGRSGRADTHLRGDRGAGDAGEGVGRHAHDGGMAGPDRLASGDRPGGGRDGGTADGLAAVARLQRKLGAGLPGACLPGTHGGQCHRRHGGAAQASHHAEETGPRWLRRTRQGLRPRARHGWNALPQTISARPDAMRRRRNRRRAGTTGTLACDPAGVLARANLVTVLTVALKCL